jgi:hypothetical protein
MRIREILFSIFVPVLLAALLYADFKWRRWIKARRQESAAAREEERRYERE